MQSNTPPRLHTHPTLPEHVLVLTLFNQDKLALCANYFKRGELYLSGWSAGMSAAATGSAPPQFFLSRLRVRLSRLPMSLASPAFTMLRNRSSEKSPS